MPRYRRTKVANAGNVRTHISDWELGLYFRTLPCHNAVNARKHILDLGAWSDWKVRMSNHFCYKCGSRFFCFFTDSAYSEGICMICGWVGCTEDVKFMVPIPLPDKEPEVMACFPGAGMSGGPLGAMHSGSLKGASSP